jgi:hypothetical protein
MNWDDPKAQLRRLYLPATDDFDLVDVPDMQFVMIDGEGDPDGEGYGHALKWLFAAVYPIKRIAKERMGTDFAEPPLECLWWADDMADLNAGNRRMLKWRLMIVTADWMTRDMLAQAVASASERLGEIPTSLRLERFDEGRCVQIMYVGDYRKEGAAIARRLHSEFLPRHNLQAVGLHHEIYLNDVSRIAPEKWRTVVRQPVR